MTKEPSPINMYQNRSRAQMFLVILCDYFIITGSLFLADYYKYRIMGSDPTREQQIWLVLAGFFVIHTLSVFFRNRYGEIFIRGYLKEFLAVINANIIIDIGGLLMLFFTKNINEYPRTVFLMFFVFDTVFMYISHVIWKIVMPKIYKKVVDRRQLLVITDKDMIKDIVRSIREMRDFSYKMMGIILIDAEPEDIGTEIEGVSIVSNLEDAENFCQTAAIDEAIVAIGNHKRQDVMNIMNILSVMGVTVHYNIRSFELDGANNHTFSGFGEFYAITYMNRSISLSNLVLKRTLDIIGGVVGSLLCLFFVIIIGPIIVIQSPGPIFFKQNRVGRNGRTFKIYKFRSMYVDAEERKKELMEKNEMEGLMFKMEDDPRITPIGRFIRKTSIDEFPQFFNVLKGDMSLVGTRPPTLDEFEKYKPEHKRRLSFKPGITGMWQVSGRNDITDFDEVVRLDVQYINNWSFYLDVKILLKTIFAAFAGK